MLICPQCQFENPNINKFCQGCGTSLTTKVCAACGMDMALNEKQCPYCGAATGTVWWAIISGSEGTTVKSDGVEELAAQQAMTFPTIPVLTNVPLPCPLPAGAYLDQQQRYQLLEPLELPSASTATTELQVRVLDCQPFQLSLLAAGAEPIIEMNIPAIAKTYIALQADFHQQIPAIHDAWQQGEQQVILIADRSNLQQLNQLWHDDATTLVQILQWFYEMTQLWAALEPWHCCQSLLELSNLRVNLDGTLGLQRLYTDLAAEQPISLQNLGQIWQRLFQESQRTKFGSLIELLADLQTQKIQTTNTLQSRLQAIANEFQANLINPTQVRLELNSTAAPIPQTEVTLTLNNSARPTILPMNESPDNLSKSDDLLPTVVLPMQLVNLADAGGTDVGIQRHHNEDYFSIETAIQQLEFPHSRTVEARGLYILCDGMGGHAGGEVASTLAVDTLQQYFQTHWQPHSPLPSEGSIREAVRLANQAIYDLNQQDARSGVGRMGTTVVLVLLHNTQVAVAHVGDSRLYRFSRKRGLEQVTLDHEVGQQEILRGVEPEIAYARSDAYQLTQALGPRDENFVNPDVQFLELNEDTLLILVSDGLSDNDLLEQNWQTHIEPLLNSGTSLQRGVSSLVDLANQYNGHDNISAVLIRAQVRPKLEPNKDEV